MATSDPGGIFARASTALARLAAAGVVSAFIAIKPVPAARPRLSKGGWAFTPEPYATFAGDLQRALAAAHPSNPMQGPLVVGVEIVKDRPKKTVLTAPLGDVDNHCKGPLDAATKTGRYWRDDVQIEHLYVTKRFAIAGEPQGIHLVINTLEDTPC